MRICIIEQGDRFPTERIIKTADSLTTAGHRIFLLCNNYGRNPAADEQVGNVRVIRLGPVFRSRALNRLVKFPLFVNPVWLAQMVRTVRRHGIEAIQVIDVPLSPAALAIGRAFRIPVVLDMWENYPEALRIWGQNDWRTLLFKNYRVARQVERWVVKRVDHIVTVVEEQRHRLIAEGVPADHVSVVTNAVDPRLFLKPSVPDCTPLDGEPGTYKLLYVGCLTTERGLDDIIRAVALLARKMPALRFYIAGAGDDEPRLRRLAEQAGVADRVRFLGWLDYACIPSCILKSDLCVVPHVASPFIDTTIPNKLFQYMALAKPVLVSNARPLARVVNGCGCGFVFESRKPESAAAKILEAYEARNCAWIGERGKVEVERSYTWAKAAEPLLELYARLSAGAARERAEAGVAGR